MKLKGLLKVALVLLAVSSLFVACDTLAGGRFPRVEKVYMKPGEDWADGRFAVWFWETGKEGSFTDMKASTEYEGLYEVNVPAGVDNVIFVKMSADSKENSWDNKEAQTDDLQVPILGDGGAVYSITAKQWIELGAKEPEPEPEPEKPEPEDAGIELSKITHIVGIGGDWANHIKLTNNTFTFYASKTKEEFVFTSGKFEDNVSYKAFGATVEEFGKEYAIITGLCGGKNQTNIVIENLKVDYEYKISLSAGSDGKLFVKVVATGNKIETPSAVYKHTVAISEISTAWKGSSEKAIFTIMLMTDEELSNLDELDDPGALRVDGGNNIVIYTPEPGNYSTSVEGVAATVTDSDLTVFIEVSGAKVEAGKKPYVLALDDNGGIKDFWSAKIVAMTQGATMPQNLIENKKPADLLEGFELINRVAGSFDVWSGSNLDSNKSYRFKASKTSITFKFQYHDGSNTTWYGDDPEDHNVGDLIYVWKDGGSDIKINNLTVDSYYEIVLIVSAPDTAQYKVILSENQSDN